MTDRSAEVLSDTVRVKLTRLWVLGGLALTASVAVTIVVLGWPRSGVAQTLGELSLLAAVLLAVAGCVAAARRGGPDRRGWTGLAAALSLYAMGVVLWTWYGVTRDHVYPFPSLADVGFVGYAVPAIAALLLFPRSSSQRGFGLRELFDATVITWAILLVSWQTVLGPLYQTGGTGLARLLGLAYPAVDIAMVSVVLVLGVRAPPSSDGPGCCSGAGWGWWPSRTAPAYRWRCVARPDSPARHWYWAGSARWS